MHSTNFFFLRAGNLEPAERLYMKTKSREGAKAAREAFWQAALQHWAATHEKERLEMTLKFASIQPRATGRRPAVNVD